MTPNDILPDATADELRAVIYSEYVSRELDSENILAQFEFALRQHRTQQIIDVCDSLSKAMMDNASSRVSVAESPIKWFESAQAWTRLNEELTKKMAQVDKLQGRK
jgi:hypothetical protein